MVKWIDLGGLHENFRLAIRPFSSFQSPISYSRYCESIAQEKSQHLNLH